MHYYPLKNPIFSVTGIPVMASKLVRKTSGILILLSLLLTGFTVDAAGSGPERDNRSILLTDRAGAVETPHAITSPHSESRNDIPVPEFLGYPLPVNGSLSGQTGHSESHSSFSIHNNGIDIYQIGRQEEKIIHITDYLYRRPEIREAYETYLRMKREAPEELQAMAQTVTYSIGDTRNFYVYNIAESTGGSPVYDEILFELRAIGEKSEIWVEVEELAPGKIDDNVVSAMMEALEVRTPPLSVNPDQGIIFNNIDIFALGNPALVPDPDGSGVVKVLISNLNDGWDPEEGGGFTAGFFNPADLAPRTVIRNSNHAAILYINSYPGIYSDDQPANPNRPLSTVAHEFQHLIQAGRGHLITFMDEGQSETAEIYNGFNGRSMVFLNDPDEVSGDVETQNADGFLRWRRGEQAVLNDYQRAQLFHSYLYERIGVDGVGRLTQSGPGNPWVQYQNMLNNSGSGLEFRNVLTEFYIANLLNDPSIGDGRYGYTLPQHAGVRVTNPGRRYGAEERSWVRNEQVRLRYGGAKYTEWRHVQDLSISLSSPPEIIHYLVLDEEDSDGPPEVIRLNGNEFNGEGLYRSATLVSVNTVVQSTANFGSRQFLYTAEWIPSEIREVEISYAVKPTAGYVPIPLDFSAESTFKGVAVRVDPTYDGVLKGVDFTLWHTPESVEGTGTLQVILTDSRRSSGQGPDAIYVPNEVITFRELDFGDLRPGFNSVDFTADEITLDAGRNYHFYFRVVDESEDAQLYFTFDQGSNDKSDQNYYPVRSMLAAHSTATGNLSGWSRLLGNPESDRDNDNKNMVMTARVLSRVPFDDDRPELPVSERFELLYNYPNPFNNDTKVSFNIPASVENEVRVLVEVYDVLGRRVKTLMDENRSAGKHDVLFRAQGLSSGIYILRMIAGGSTDTHKLMLLK
jgi:hypothetical protein